MWSVVLNLQDRKSKVVELSTLINVSLRNCSTTYVISYSIMRKITMDPFENEKNNNGSIAYENVLLHGWSESLSQKLFDSFFFIIIDKLNLFRHSISHINYTCQTSLKRDYPLSSPFQHLPLSEVVQWLILLLWIISQEWKEQWWIHSIRQYIITWLKRISLS